MKAHQCEDGEVIVYDESGLHTYKPCLVCFAEEHGFNEADIARAFAALRTKPSGGHNGGRPRSKERCPCGANTLKRATARNFDCCKKTERKKTS